METKVLTLMVNEIQRVFGAFVQALEDCISLAVIVALGTNLNVFQHKKYIIYNTKLQMGLAWRHVGLKYFVCAHFGYKLTYDL